MQRNILPNSSACIRPAGVNSPPHFNMRTNDGSVGLSTKTNKKLEYSEYKRYFFLYGMSQRLLIHFVRHYLITQEWYEDAVFTNHFPVIPVSLNNAEQIVSVKHYSVLLLTINRKYTYHHQNWTPSVYLLVDTSSELFYLYQKSAHTWKTFEWWISNKKETNILLHF